MESVLNPPSFVVLSLYMHNESKQHNDDIAYENRAKMREGN